MLASLVCLLLISQTPPAIKLTVPEKPVPYARVVKMKVEVPDKTVAPGDYETYSVEWDVTERVISDNPLENDLDVDSNTLKATIPSGDHATSVKIKVTVTFIYKDYSKRVAREVKYVQIGTTVPVPPGPIPPAPTPIPVPPPVIVPVAEVYGMTTWSLGQLQKSAMSKDQSKTLAESFHQIAMIARQNGYGDDKNKIIAAMATRNKEVLGTNLQTWIDGFLQPLQAKVNPLNPLIKTVADQAQLFDEIGNGLAKYGSTN